VGIFFHVSSDEVSSMDIIDELLSIDKIIMNFIISTSSYTGVCHRNEICISCQEVNKILNNI